MIAQLTGNFLHKTPTRLVVETGGVGYEVNISLNTYTAIVNAEKGTLLTHLKVSEDAFTLFGFAAADEKDMFIKLIGITGVGASTARMMLSSLKPQEIQQAIASKNVKLLESVKGIGKKTAERIALELRDKLSPVDAGISTFATQHNTPESEALEGLIALGIGRPLAEQAIKKAMTDQTAIPTVETIIKLALKFL